MRLEIKDHGRLAVINAIGAIANNLQKIKVANGAKPAKRAKGGKYYAIDKQ